MRILRAIQLTGFMLSLGAFLMIGHQYYSAMTTPDGNSARFVSANGEVTRQGQGAPTFRESTTALLAGLLGKEPEKNDSLSALHTRTRTAQMSYDDYAMREITFWSDFMSKLGFTGP